MSDFTIGTLAQQIGYTQSPATPMPFLSWYAGYRGDLTTAEQDALSYDSPVEPDVAEEIIRAFQETT